MIERYCNYYSDCNVNKYFWLLGAAVVYIWLSGSATTWLASPVDRVLAGEQEAWKLDIKILFASIHYPES